MALNLKTRTAATLLSALITYSCATSPTGRKQFIAIGEGQMAEMGAASFQEMKGQIPQDSDPATNRYVRCVADAITAQTKQSETGVKTWEVVVFKDETPNAFALPGGKIGVHTGMLKSAQTQGQLAAVLGHEVGHVIAHHGAERVSQQMAAQGLLIGAGVAVGKDNPNAGLIMAGLGLGAQYGVLLPFSRTHESEADVIGLDLMARAGFDPHQAVDLWKNMAAAGGGGAPPEFLSTHPADATRIKNLESKMGPALEEFKKAQAAGRKPKCGP